MNPFKTYSIQYVNLNEGDHQYNYIVDNAFFELFNHNVYNKARFDVMLHLNRHGNIITLLFTIKGSITTDCDVCLEELTVNIETVKAVLVKSADTNPDDVDEDEVIIADNDSEINVAQHIYDFITLAVPARNVHPTDKNGNSTCNPNVIKELDKHQPGTHDTQETDPRWEKLKGIKIK